MSSLGNIHVKAIIAPIKANSSGKLAIVLIFLCHWKAGEPQTLEDTIGVKWISADELDALEFAPNVKTYVQLAF